MIGESTVIQEKGVNYKKFCSRVIMCISVAIIGILLIPIGIGFLSISLIWKMTDKILRHL